jgi:hypothetical protein
VDFHGRHLELIGRDGEPYVAMKPFVEAMGLAWAPQHRKLTDEPDRWCVTTMVIVQTGDGKAREVTCIPLSHLPAWMNTLQTSRMGNPGAVEIVKLFQAESDAVLWHHWRQGKARPEVEPFTIPATPKTAVELLLELAKFNVLLTNATRDLELKLENLEVFQDSVVEATDAAINFVHKRVDIVDERVSAIDERYQAIRQNILNLDELDGTEQRLSDRKKVIIIVENYVNAMTAGKPDDYKKAWKDLYNEYDKSQRTVLTYHSNRGGLSKLDYIEQCGKMGELLILARGKYAAPLLARVR